VDLGCVGFAERTAEDAEVVRVDEHLAAVDGAPTRDDAVGVRPAVLQAEAGRAMPAQWLELGERPLVEEQLDALAGGELAARVLRLGRPRPGPRVHLGTQLS
jgi:hypothetical protein